MPTGIYHRSEEYKKSMRENLAKGHLPEAREKANSKMRELGKDEEWRNKVSQSTIRAMHDPEIRERHLRGLHKAIELHGINFKGGNGQPVTEIVKQYNEALSPLGYIREYPIPTKDHGTNEKPPTSYKVDFGNPDTMIAIELDGQSHFPLLRQAQDKKKTKVLEALGWTVIRIKHK